MSIFCVKRAFHPNVLLLDYSTLLPSGEAQCNVKKNPRFILPIIPIFGGNHTSRRKRVGRMDIWLNRPSVPWGAGGAMAPPDFDRSVNPISTRVGRSCPHITS